MMQIIECGNKKEYTHPLSLLHQGCSFLKRLRECFCNIDNANPIMWAIELEYSDVGKILIQNGGDFLKGDHPLSFAFFCGNTHVLYTLLKEAIKYESMLKKHEIQQIIKHSLRWNRCKDSKALDSLLLYYDVMDDAYGQP